MRRRKPLLLLCALGLIALLGTALATARMVRQNRLDRDLIATVEQRKPDRVTTLLRSVAYSGGHGRWLVVR